MVILAVLRSLSFPKLGSSVDMTIYIHGVFDRAHSIAGFASTVKPQFAEVRNDMMYEIRNTKYEVSKANHTASFRFRILYFPPPPPTHTEPALQAQSHCCASAQQSHLSFRSNLTAAQPQSHFAPHGAKLKISCTRGRMPAEFDSPRMGAK